MEGLLDRSLDDIMREKAKANAGVKKAPKKGPISKDVKMGDSILDGPLQTGKRATKRAAKKSETSQQLTKVSSGKIAKKGVILAKRAPNGKLVAGGKQQGGDDAPRVILAKRTPNGKLVAGGKQLVPVKVPRGMMPVRVGAPPPGWMPVSSIHGGNYNMGGMHTGNMGGMMMQGGGSMMEMPYGGGGGGRMGRAGPSTYMEGGGSGAAGPSTYMDGGGGGGTAGGMCAPRGEVFDMGPPKRRMPQVLPGCKLMVSNLYEGVVDKDLKNLFSRGGRVPLVSCNVDWDPSGRSLGTAVIIFSDPEDARAARDEFNRSVLDGMRMQLAIAGDGQGGGGRAPRGGGGGYGDRQGGSGRNGRSRGEY